MNKYRVDYMDGDGEILTIEIETRAVIRTQGHLIFLDEHGEDGYVFNKEDVICYEMMGRYNEGPRLKTRRFH